MSLRCAKHHLKVVVWLSLLFLLPFKVSGSATFLFDLSDDLNQPSAVSILPDGHALVLDGLNGRIVLFANDGSPQNSFGKTKDKPLKLPMDLAIANQQIIVADSGNQRLVLFDLNGDHLSSLPLPSDKRPAEPTGLVVLGSDVYWSDRGNHRICRTRIKTGETLQCWGKYGEGEDSFRFPFMITADADEYLHVVDVLNGRIQLFNNRGRAFGAISRFGTLPGTLLRPNGIVMDDQGQLFVSDNHQGHISLFRNRRFVGRLADEVGQSIRFDQPVGLARWQDRLYVVEMGKNRVRVFRLNQLGEDASAQITEQQITEPSRKNCVTCHLSWAPGYMPDQVEHPLIPPVADERMCLSCHHGAVIDSRAALKRGHQHPDLHHLDAGLPLKSVAERKESFAGVMPLIDGNTPYCGSCHTPHAKNEEDTGIHPGHNNAWMRQSNKDGDLCILCHEAHQNSEAVGNALPQKANHPLGIRLQQPPEEGEKGYAKERVLHKGLPATLKQHGGRIAENSEMMCESCHRLHGAKGEPLLLLKRIELCAECHPRQETADKEAARHKGIHPVHEKLEQPITIDGRKVTSVECGSCHYPHGALADTPLLNVNKPEQLCQECHEKQYANGREEAREKGIHPMNVKLEKPVRINNREISEIGCESCHSVHEGRSDTPSLVMEVKAGELCAVCHPRQHAEDKEDARKKGVHPVNMTLDEAVQIGERQIKQLDCLTCHSVHGGKPHTPSLVMQYQAGELCEKCHEAQVKVRDTDHDLRITAPKSQNLLEEQPAHAGLCGSCHSLHRGKDGSSPLYIGAMPPADSKEPSSKRDRICLSCHQEKSVAEKVIVDHYDHPFRDLVLRSDPKVLPLLDEKESNVAFGRIGCITCHDPHRWSPAEAEKKGFSPVQTENKKGTVLNSFLRRVGPKGSFCVDCHGLESAVRWKYFHDKRGRPQQADYIR
ncbi:MAG: hypothetical protein DIZ77_04275 [endosymbiont of Seepiophila jonesi]|uniref:Doubled CXXCH motif domain-containing protein n=1 Tax=endosymbiont of Lamellibrachia luymesi TaxID=2200907 RepID=A0A370DNW9_9GAMM|nr:MAG: hypothetical protein DIZ79_16115 [endosymbiont of Lamellibrachia luymesi]RDH93872.1 MAG: hypothetical protein DIZ77_04275 [endosymbiont of Seepiophila jonesi]